MFLIICRIEEAAQSAAQQQNAYQEAVQTIAAIFRSINDDALSLLANLK
jgi:hypothetical protein